MGVVIVYHGGYGCDTGCCGHYVQLYGKREEFSFDHPNKGENPRDFAERMIREEFSEEHVANLDWENCHIEEW